MKNPYSVSFIWNNDRNHHKCRRMSRQWKKLWSPQRWSVHNSQPFLPFFSFNKRYSASYSENSILILHLGCSSKMAKHPNMSFLTLIKTKRIELLTWSNWKHHRLIITASLIFPKNQFSSISRRYWSNVERASVLHNQFRFILTPSPLFHDKYCRPVSIID